MALQKLLHDLISRNVLANTHDCSEDKLSIAIVESYLTNKSLLRIELDDLEIIDRTNLTLFSKNPSHVMISTRQKEIKQMLKTATDTGIPTKIINRITSHSRMI